MNTPKLDKLLKEWRTHQHRGPEALQKLEERVTRALASERYLGAVSPHSATDGAPVHARWIWAWAVGVCALALVSGLVVRSHIGRTLPAAATWAMVAPAELATQRVLFEESESLFAQHLKWIVQSGNSVHLEIQPEPASVREPAGPMMIRFVVVRKMASGKKWENVWQTDVLVRGQEWVQFRVGPGPKDEIRLWFHQNSDGTYVMESGLALTAPVRLAAESEAILRVGQPREITRTRTAGVEYRLYQTLEALKGCG
ncbi:MAG: hypothetical protein KJ726_03625 [Verrucomicrobia bacterium]|nr:hypothetical protein [Verrucomicrobiota bacterium]MBU1909116.1 hypothetical protein [Verrucomicrobiota bacterium]